MSGTIAWIAGAVLAYLIGAIPTGLLVGKWTAGIDIREHGSKNIGFTNAVRVLGWKRGWPVLVIDIVKAWGAVWGLAHALDHPVASGFGVMLGAATLLGNLLNVFLRFKGGKGVAAAAGVYIALAPGALGIAFAVWAVILGTTRYMSLASILAAATLPVATWWTLGIGPVFWFALVTGILVIVKHRANVARLMAGTEARFGRSSPQPPPAQG